MARFRIDPRASRVRIDARSSLHPVHSESTGIEGWFEAALDADGALDLSTPPAGHVELGTTTLSSGNSLYDREMHRRIDVRRYPAITGELVEMKDTPTPGRYRLEGDVTFRGTTRRAVDEMTVARAADGTLLLEGEHTFDIRAFGMEPPRMLTLRVYPEVRMKVALVATQEGDS